MIYVFRLFSVSAYSNVMIPRKKPTQAPFKILKKKLDQAQKKKYGLARWPYFMPGGSLGYFILRKD